MHNYNFHDLFSVATNIDYFEGMFHAFEGKGESKFSLQFLLDNRLRVSTKGKPSVNLMLYHNSDESAVEFSYPWLAQICAKFVVSQNHLEYRFLFNKNYLRFSNIIAEGWELVDILRSVLLVSLIEHESYMVHGAAVKIGDEGILIPSFGNTGKTTTSWTLAKRGAGFLTDEFAVIDAEGRCFGFPCSSIVSSRLVETLRLKLNAWQNISLLSRETRSKLLSTRFASGGIKAYPDQLFKIVDSTEIRTMVFLQNGIDAARQISEEEALTRLRAVQSYEMSWKSSPWLLAKSYFEPGFDLEGFSHNEDLVLRRIFGRIKRFYLVSSSRADHYKMIEKIMS